MYDNCNNSFEDSDVFQLRPGTSVIKAVVFDMDGVILDSEKLVQECWEIIAERYGIPDVASTCRRCLGLTRQATIREFQKVYGPEFPYETYKKEVRALFYGEKYGDHLPLKPGVEELLIALKDHHIPIALASSTHRQAVTKELSDAGVLQYFDKLICGDMVTMSKPDPEIFQKAADELGFRPDQCLAVEDSYNGIRSAYAAGLLPVMVPDQVPPTEEIRQLTYAVCENLDRLREMMSFHPIHPKTSPITIPASTSVG